MAGWTKFLALVAALVAVSALPAQAQAQTVLPAGFEQRTSVAGFSQGVGAAYAPDGRVFMVEKGGIVRVARRTGRSPRSCCSTSPPR